MDCLCFRTSKSIVCFSVGKRTKRTPNVVLKTLLLSKAKRIYPNDLRQYKKLCEKNEK